MEENNGSGTNPQHISMELTADGARVTSLSLKGNRLVLTIEAQLADSRLNAGADAPVPAPEPASDQSIEEAKFVEPSRAAGDEDSAWFVAAAAALGEQDDTQLVDHGKGAEERERSNTDVIGELAKEPAAESAFANEAVLPSSDGPVIGLAPEPLAADDDSIVASISLEPAFQADEETSWDIPTASGASADSTAPIEPGDDVWKAGPAVVAPPLEPVREVTDTWDASNESGRALPRLEGVNTVLTEPSKAEAPANAFPGADKEIADSVDDTEWGVAAEMPPVPPLEPVKELTDTWDKVPEPVSDLTGRPEAIEPPRPAEPERPEEKGETDETDVLPAIADESSAIGGERHGEPQPAFSFGVTDQPAPTPEPEPEAKAPAPEENIEPKQESEDKALEPGGTTVLIRYTCPRCKTQGMQAVDKVGTVVNCSNCGKAMRLVMKK